MSSGFSFKLSHQRRKKKEERKKESLYIYISTIISIQIRNSAKSWEEGLPAGRPGITILSMFYIHMTNTIEHDFKTKH